MIIKALCAVTAGLLAGSITMTSAAPGTGENAGDVQTVVNAAIEPMMTRHGIPGMAVGVIDGDRQYIYNYGVASKETGQPVTRDTLFELGSVSKTLTATLTSYAQLQGKLSLSDTTAQYLPSQRDSAFGMVSLLELGTHTPGGLPLQVPDNIHDNGQLMQYFKAWRPDYAPGTYRTYANPGIGTLGLITAKSMGEDFDKLMEGRLLPALGLRNSFIHVPSARLADYAQGYTKQDTPIRMQGGVLASEAYGIKSTAADMTRFLAENMQSIKLDPMLQRAITQTHTGYFKAGPMTQDLIWEQYPYPVTLKALLDGNSSSMARDATPVSAIQPPLAPRNDVWINKTGSTNGFGSYLAFVPQKRLGIVILGNRNFPIDARVSAAYQILTALDKDAK